MSLIKFLISKLKEPESLFQNIKNNVNKREPKTAPPFFIFKKRRRKKAAKNCLNHHYYSPFPGIGRITLRTIFRWLVLKHIIFRFSKTTIIL